jgi:hypothetical protein
MMTRFDPQTEKHLALSVEQYRELQQHADKLLDILDNCDYSRVHEHAARLQELQTAACQQDEVLLPLLKQDLPTWEEHPLYQKRMRFISSILKSNELLLPKIRGMMAVTSVDLEQLQSGRTAIAGYALPKADQRSSRGTG